MLLKCTLLLNESRVIKMGQLINDLHRSVLRTYAHHVRTSNTSLPLLTVRCASTCLAAMQFSMRKAYCKYNNFVTHWHNLCTRIGAKLRIHSGFLPKSVWVVLRISHVLEIGNRKCRVTGIDQATYAVILLL